jgi:cytochrome c peroxidase
MNVQPAFAAFALGWMGTYAVAQVSPLAGTFPNVAVPAGNPMTPEKVELGKALFFEEQLSSDDTVACATCHLPEAGGGDPRAGARAPGDDGRIGTLDDDFGSPGVVRRDVLGNFEDDPTFGVNRQVTGRNSPSVIAAAFFNTQFWDRRAGPVFRDHSGQVVLSEFASLETQAVEPPISSIEMGHAQRDWSEIAAKLARVRPLALASDIPLSLAQFIGDHATYGPLFEQAFGSPEITRERVAMAIATYERTLVPDQTPFDLGTMTQTQLQGWNAFRNHAVCETCHRSSNGLFSDGLLQRILLPGHRRFVKTPSLRNVGLRPRFMSSGQFVNLFDVLQHYERLGFFRPRPGDSEALKDFLENALTDPRVATRQPPFDRPTLRSERVPAGSNQFGMGRRGSGNAIPIMLSDSPPFLGNPGFQIGLGEALGYSRAVLLVSPSRAAPDATFLGVPIAIDADHARFKLVPTSRGGAGHGVATVRISLPVNPALLGEKFYAQWLVRDAVAAGGISVTRAAEFEIFTRP